MRTNFTCADHFTPNIRNAFNLILRLLGVHCTVVLIKLLNDGKTTLLTKDKKNHKQNEVLETTHFL